MMGGQAFNPNGMNMNMILQNGMNMGFQMMQNGGFGDIMQQAMQSGNGPPPTSQNTIASLPEYEYQCPIAPKKEMDKDNDEEEEKVNEKGSDDSEKSECHDCAICKEEFKD